jgi:hypothetical protein
MIYYYCGCVFHVMTIFTILLSMGDSFSLKSITLWAFSNHPFILVLGMLLVQDHDSVGSLLVTSLFVVSFSENLILLINAVESLVTM